MKKPLRIGAYIRVSTDKQVQVFEGSLETQKFRMQEFVKTRNKEIKSWGQIVDYYVDEALSAGTDKRPEYQRLMSDIRSGRVNLVLIADISRLSRSVHDFSVLLKTLEEHDASYLSLKEQFDTTTPAGRLMTNMVVTMAQFEREQTSERVSINTNARALRGLVNGGRPPIGLARDPLRPGLLFVQEDEAVHVRTIFKTFLKEGSLGKTMPVLEALSIFPKNRGRGATKDSEGRAWNHQTLWEHLTNVAYIGLREVNKGHRNADADHLKPWQQYTVVKAAWGPIVSEDDFKAVQDMLRDNQSAERRRLDRAHARVFLLSGILHCGECGRSLSGQSAHSKNLVHRYYGHSDKRVKPTLCSIKRIRADEIEQVVINHFFKITNDAGYFKAIEQKLGATLKFSEKSEKSTGENLRKQLGDVEREITSTFRIQASASMGGDSLSVVAAHLEQLAQKKKTLLTAINEADSFASRKKEIPAQVQGLQQLIQEFKRGYSKASPAMKRRLLRKVLKGLTLKTEGLEVTFHIGEPARVQSEPGSNVVDISSKRVAPVGEESDLSLLSAELPVVRNGWGGRGRTCE